MRTWLLTFIKLLSVWRRKYNLSPDKKQVDHLIADLGNCTAEMKHECKLVEADFLDIGEHLQTIFHQAYQLTQNARSAVEYIGLDHENNLLAEITRITQRAMADLDKEKTVIQESLKSIQGIGDQLLTIRNMIGGLNQIAKTLKVVAVNINIESSRSTESQEFFKAMPQEIQSLADTMLEVVRTLSDETEAIAINLGDANQTMNRKLDNFHELVKSAHTLVNATASDVKDLINRSIRTFQYVGNDAQVLSQSVGEIVQSIQIHDNISQRVQHVAEALIDVCQNLTDSDERSKAIALMDANLELQHSQFKNIISDIDNTYQQSTQSFETIGRTVENISMNLAEIVSVGASDRNIEIGMSNSIGFLNDALKKIQGLIDQGTETVAELKGTVQEATTVVARISDHMKHMLDVNFDIHLKSLNAIIGSVRLGDEGKSVGVIVQEMKDLAHRSNEIVAQVDNINTSITNDVNVLCGRIDDSVCGSNRTTEIEREDLKASINKFDDTVTAFIQGAENVTRLSSSLAEQVRATTSKLGFLKTFSDQIRKQLTQLDALRTRLSPWIDAESSLAVLDRKSLSARYTMQKERDIQATVLATADPESEGRAPDVPPDESVVHLEAAVCEQDCHTTAECELGDNVELF